MAYVVQFVEISSSGHIHMIKHAKIHVVGPREKI
jgi:hypothetical protein